MSLEIFEFIVGTTISAAIAGSVLFAFFFIFFLAWAVPRFTLKWIWLAMFSTFWICPVLKYAKTHHLPESSRNQNISERYDEAVKCDESVSFSHAF